MASRELSLEAEALWREAEDAVERDRRRRLRGDSPLLDPAPRLCSLLERLAAAAPPRSDAWLYAHRQLAERVVVGDPWRASVLARRVLEAQADDDGAWAMVGLSQSLLGNHRYAVASYRRAIRLAPGNPWYAHNLGHLYDVALDRPALAVPLLRRALQLLPGCVRGEAAKNAWCEVAASYAHALMRTGDVRHARSVMRQVMRHRPRPEHHALYRCIVEGAEGELAERIASVAPTDAAPRRRLKRRRTSKR
jgi:tetratricopeptide (TPR) repeat protein